MFRPQLEALETRETPAASGGASVALPRLAAPTPPPAQSAVVFVGGWGSSMYQYAGDSYYGTGVYKSQDSGRTW